MLVGSFFEKSWCYEISEQRQDIIRGNAELSNLSDRMSYEEKLKVNFGEDLAQSVLFMDIEGAEFELFHGVLFETLKNSIFLLSYMTGCYLTERSNLTGQDETLITSSKSAR